MNHTFEEIHHDLSEWHGTAFPLEELEKCPYNVNDYKEKDMLTYLNEYDKIRCNECGRYNDEFMKHDKACSKSD